MNQSLDEMNRDEIPLSKKKMTLLILASFGFVAAGVFLWTIADSQPRFHPIYVKAVSIACIAFFGLCGVYGCVKFFDRKPGLVIDEEGIIDNSSGVAFGRIPWNDIVRLRISVVAGQKFLTIDVVDPQEYIDRCGFLSRKLHAANLSGLGSPIAISSNALAIGFDDLMRIMTEAFNRQKNPSLRGKIQRP